MNTAIVLERLQQMLLQSRQDLEKYTTRSNPSTSYVEFRNRELALLTAIYQQLASNQLQLEPYWLQAETFFRRAKADAGVSDVTIKLNLRETGTSAYIELNNL